MTVSEEDLMQLHATHANFPYTPGVVESESDRIVRLAKSGDETAFAELYQMHSRAVARVIQRIVKNVDDRDDVLQETFIKAFVHLKNFDGRSQFSTWLTRIAINTSLMLLRKRRNRPECSIDLDFDREGSAFQIVDPAPDPEKVCLRENSITEVRYAVGRLPKSLRLPTAIRCSQDLLVRDIANIAGLSVSATKSRLVRAAAELRVMLDSNADRQSRPCVKARRAAPSPVSVSKI
jgi:RNA polymerase sigma-70 factor (ECF subfamily)